MLVRTSGLLVVGLVIAITTVSRSAPGPGEKSAEKADYPCVVVWHDAGYKVRNPNEGIRIAIWSDGTILFSPDPCRLGRNMVVGQAPKEDVQELLATIRNAGFLEDRRGYSVPDASDSTIIVRDGSKMASHSWHDYLVPGMGSDLNTDSEYRAFVRMWKKTSGAIESLTPVEIARLDEKLGKERVFRGYVVDEPRKTPWRSR
jgi:hypothetical protein